MAGMHSVTRAQKRGTSFLGFLRKCYTGGGLTSKDMLSPSSTDNSSLRLKQIGVFCLTYVSYCSLYGTRKPFSVVKAHLQEALGLTPFFLGAIDTCFLTFYAIGQFTVPTIAAKFVSRRTLLLVAYMGSSLCAIVFGRSRAPFALLVAWSLNGLFHSSVYPLLIRAMAPWFAASSRGQVLGTWTTSQQTGSLLSTAFAAYFAESFGWRTAFTVPGQVVGVVGVFLYLLIPEHTDSMHSSEGIKVDSPPKSSPMATGVTPTTEDLAKQARGQVGGAFPTKGPVLMSRSDSVRSEGPVSTIELTTVGSGKHHTTGHRPPRPHEAPPLSSQHSPVIPVAGADVSVREALQVMHVKNVAAAYFFVKCVRYSLLFWLPFYMANGLGYDKATAAYSSMMFDVGGIAGAVFTGFLSDVALRGQRLRAGCGMLLLGSLAIFVFALTAPVGLVPALTSMAFVGFALAGPDSVLGAAAAQDLCDKSLYGLQALSPVTGVVNGMGSCGAVVQGFLTAGISEAFGWHALFVTLSGCLITAACFLLPVVWSPSSAPAPRSKAVGGTPAQASTAGL